MNIEATGRLGVRGIQDQGIQGIQPRPAPRAGDRPAGRSPFEALLGKVTRGVENLQEGASGNAGRLRAEGIRQPEDLEAALLEAERNYKNARELGKDLVKAYKATLENLGKP